MTIPTMHIPLVFHSGSFTHHEFYTTSFFTHRILLMSQVRFKQSIPTDLTLDLSCPYYVNDSLPAHPKKHIEHHSVNLSHILH